MAERLMPEAVAAVVAAIKVVGTTVAAASAATAAGTATATQLAITVAANVALAATLNVATSAFQPKVSTSGAAIEWTADPDAPMHFAFGRVGVAGQIVHNATFGPDLMYAGFIGVLSAAGPIDGYVGFKANDQTVTFDGNGKAITSEYANEMWLKRQTGEQPTSTAMTVTGLKNSAAMPNWDAASKLSAKAAYQYILGENSKRSAYGGRVPTGIHTFRGLRCWDPRLDDTYPGGAGDCRIYDPDTWVYSTNAYLHALKWVLGLWEGPTLKGAPAHGSTTDYQVGGIGAKVEGVIVQDYVESANAFDENEGWACAAWPSTDDSKAGVLDSFLQAGGGLYAQKAGKIGCVHRIATRASVATISGADTAGPIELTLTASRKDRINTLRPRYWSEEHKWQMTAAGEVTSAVWQEEDGQGQPVKRTRGLDFNYVPSAQQATELAALQIAHTREPIKGVIPLRPYMMGLDVGDCITITEPDFVLDGQKVLILDIDDQTAADVIRVSFVSETDAKYPFAYGEESDPPPAPDLDPDNSVAAPDPGDWSLAAAMFTEGGVSVPALVFSGEVTNARADRVIFEFRVVGSPNWVEAGTADPTVVRREVTGLTPSVYEGAVSYRVRGRISPRLVLGPVTAGVLVSGDVSPTSPVITDLTDRLFETAAAQADSFLIEEARRRAGDADQQTRLDVIGEVDPITGTVVVAPDRVSVGGTPIGDVRDRVVSGLDAEGAVAQPIPEPILRGSGGLNRDIELSLTEDGRIVLRDTAQSLDMGEIPTAEFGGSAAADALQEALFAGEVPVRAVPGGAFLHEVNEVAQAALPASSAGDLAVLDKVDTPQIEPFATQRSGGSSSSGTTTHTNLHSGGGGTQPQGLATAIVLTTGKPINVRAGFGIRARHGDDDWTLTVEVIRTHTPAVGGVTATTIYSNAVKCFPIAGDGWVTSVPPIDIEDDTTPAGGSNAYVLRISSDRSSAFAEFSVNSKYCRAQEFKA